MKEKFGIQKCWSNIEVLGCVLLLLATWSIFPCALWQVNPLAAVLIIPYEIVITWLTAVGIRKFEEKYSSDCDHLYEDNGQEE